MYECYFSERVPKNTYCGINKMELAVYDSVAVFNYGRQASLAIYKMVNVKPGQYTTACHSMNISKKYNASYITRDTSKKRRKVIRVGKMKKDDTRTES